MSKWKPANGSLLLDDMVARFGVDDTLKIATLLGGRRFFMPERLCDDHIAVRTVGRELAEKMRFEYVGNYLEIPNSLRRDVMIREMFAQQPRPSINEIAERFVMPYRSITRILARQPKALLIRESRPAQVSFFDE